jgi:transcriptional regulator with XRE-family HTH domain
MAKVTKASCALKAVVKPERVMTQKQLSEALDCTQQAVSAWLNGVSQPDTERRQKIEAMFQIPVSDWAEAMPPAPASSGDVSASADAANDDVTITTPGDTGTEG